MRAIAFVAVLLTAGPALAQSRLPDAGPIVAAERAFAADAPVMGLTASFNKWSVPDAVMIAGGQVQTVRDVFPPDVPRPAEEIRLEWWPNFAGISASGDLGFTTGGVAVNGQRTGHYVTVWARQDDGSWKWIYDGGNGSPSADAAGPESEPRVLSPGEAFSRPGRVIDELLAAESVLAMGSAMGERLSARRYADDAVLYVGRRPPATGREAIAAALAAQPADLRFGPTEGATASEAGDLAYTFGPVRWTSDGQPREGHYVRIWQWRPGWKIVLDQIIPAPPPPPSPPPPPAGG